MQATGEPEHVRGSSVPKRAIAYLPTSETYDAAALPALCEPALGEPPLRSSVRFDPASIAVEPQTRDASQLIFAAAREGIYGLDANGLTTFANPAAQALTGWRADELVGRPQHAMIHHSYADGRPYPKALCPIYAALNDGRVHSSESEVFWRKDGSCFAVAYTITPILKDGRPQGAVVFFQDISARRRVEAWEKTRNAIFFAITSLEPLSTSLGMLTVAVTELFPGASASVLLRGAGSLQLAACHGIPETLQSLLFEIDAAEPGSLCARAAELGRELSADGGSGQPWKEATAWGPGHCLAMPLLSASGDGLGVIALFTDDAHPLPPDAFTTLRGVCDLARIAIEHSNLHAQLVRQSQHDALTDLPNRLVLEDRLERSILRARRYGTLVAVCCLDLDHFKNLNDTHGHSAGDDLLRQVADRLRNSLKDTDTVARQGGDEFIVMLPDLKSEQEVESICNRVLEDLRQPFVIAGHAVSISASMGHSVWSASSDHASELLQQADIALYAAKCAGRDRVQGFNASLGSRVQREIDIHRELRSALGRGQFSIVYQPIYDGQRHLRGFEALLRWTHPSLGAVSPGQFIPIAEKTGLIVAIGEWVLNQSCRQAQAWNATSAEPVMIFVNVSSVQLGQANFTETIARALADSGLHSSLLNLEITETSIIADAGAAAGRLSQLRALGVRISIDDFGSGHSSFSYLQLLPIDTIKIDQAFISCLDGTDKQSAIVRTIVALAGELGLETVAEGIETGPQFEEMQSTDCTFFQGYLLARPMTPEDAGMLLTEQQLA